MKDGQYRLSILIWMIGITTLYAKRVHERELWNQCKFQAKSDQSTWKNANAIDVQINQVTMEIKNGVEIIGLNVTEPFTQKQSKEFQLQVKTEYFSEKIFEQIIQIMTKFYNGNEYGFQIFMLLKGEILTVKVEYNERWEHDNIVKQGNIKYDRIISIEEQQEYEDNESNDDNSYPNYYEQLSDIIEKIGAFQLILIIFPKLLQDNVKKKSMNENSMGNYSCLLLLCVIVITAGTIFYLRGQYMSLFQIVITRFNNSTNKSSQNQYEYNSFAQTLLENTHSIRVDGKQNNWLKSNAEQNLPLQFVSMNDYKMFENTLDKQEQKDGSISTEIFCNDFNLTELDLCQIRNVIEETTWTKIRIFDKMDEYKATTLSMSRDDFICKINDFINGKPEVSSIVISLESILWIIRIFEGVDIGILLKHDEKYKNIKVDGIYLDKQRIYDELNITNGKCNVLDNFISDIDELNIVNEFDYYSMRVNYDMNISSDIEWESESTEVIYVETDWEEWEDDGFDSELDEKMEDYVVDMTRNI